jgi:hypothetical protein
VLEASISRAHTTLSNQTLVFLLTPLARHDPLVVRGERDPQVRIEQRERVAVLMGKVGLLRHEWSGCATASEWKAHWTGRSPAPRIHSWART